jgi:hypothetical protein
MNIVNNDEEKNKYLYEFIKSKHKNQKDTEKNDIIINKWLIIQNYLPPKKVIDFFLKNNYKNTLIYLMNDKNLKLSLSEYKYWLFSMNPYKYSNLDIFEQMSMDNELNKTILEFTCEHLKYESICDILNQKIMPTNKCFKNLFSNKNNKNLLLDTMDLLIKFGYVLTDDDIVYATIKGVQLNDCIFTRKYIPSEKFYDACFSHRNSFPFSKPFIPNYNELCVVDINKKMMEREKRRIQIENITKEKEMKKTLNIKSGKEEKTEEILDFDIM